MLYHFEIILKQLSGQISCHCILIFVHCQVQSLCWPLCGEVISILNLKTMCLRCILLPTSFQISRSSDKENRKESDVDMEVEVDEVDEKG